MFRRLRRVGLISVVTTLLLGLTQGAAANTSDAVTGRVGSAAGSVPAAADGDITISGQIVALSTGATIAGVCVELRTGVVTVFATSCSDASGHYAIEAPAGFYTLRASGAGYVPAWAGERYIDYQEFDFSTSTVMDFSMVQQLPSATGQLVDPSGVAVSGALVWFRAVIGPFWTMQYTDANGRFTFLGLPPKAMKVSVAAYTASTYPLQYVPGKTGPVDATVFTPGDGEVLTINEQFLPYGGIKVTFVDDTSGHPLSDVCITDAYFGTRCTDVMGTAALSLPFGPRALTLTVPTAYQPAPAPIMFDIVPGQITSHRMELRRRTSIFVTAQEGANPNWQPPTCVIAVPVQPGVFASPEQTAYRPYCSSYNEGPIEVWLDQAIPVQLFAYSGSTTDANGPPKFGAQWVTANGGTGDRRNALVITPVTGVRNQGPVIKMDPPMALYGSVDSPVAGQYCVSALALPLTVPGEARDMQVQTCTYEVAEGSPRFSMNGLGPYSWPLFFTSKDGTGASAWSGGASNRFAAVLVGPAFPIIGQQMPGLGGTIRGTISGKTGGQMLAYDAVTGDYLAKGAVSGNAFVITGLNSRPVLLQYRPTTGTACWPSLPPIGTAPRVRPRSSLAVTVGQVSTVTLDVSTSCAGGVKLITKVDQPFSS